MLRLILNLLRQKPAQPPPEALAWSLFSSVSFSLETCSYGYLLVFQVPRVERVCAVSESGMPTYNILNYDNQRLLDVHFTCPLWRSFRDMPAADPDRLQCLCWCGAITRSPDRWSSAGLCLVRSPLAWLSWHSLPWNASECCAGGWFYQRGIVIWYMQNIVAWEPERWETNYWRANWVAKPKS